MILEQLKGSCLRLLEVESQVLVAGSIVNFFQIWHLDPPSLGVPVLVQPQWVAGLAVYEVYLWVKVWQITSKVAARTGARETMDMKIAGSRHNKSNDHARG